MSRAFKTALVHLLEQRLEGAEVGVALELVAGQPLAQEIVLAHACLDPPRVDKVGELHSFKPLPRPLDHARMMALKLSEEKVHGRGGAQRCRLTARTLRPPC